jgi:hypothetical protein
LSAAVTLWSASFASGAAALSVQVWCVRGAGSPVSQDDWLVEWLPGGVLRVAVLDGVTPWESEHPSGEDAAVWAAGVARTAARAVASPAEVLEQAHRTLWRADLVPSRRRPSVSAAVADLTAHHNATGAALSVQAASAADCEVWAHDDAGWGLVVGGDALDPAWRRLWEQRRAANPQWSDAERLAAEAAFLDDPACRPYPAVGRQEPLTLREGGREDCGAVVVASDGAKLGMVALDDLPGHLDAVCSDGAADMTVVLVRVADGGPRLRPE